MLVDLFTQDSELESIFLEEFPDKFFPDEQFYIDTSDPQTKIFCFYDLDYDKINKFLCKYRIKHEFEIRGKEGEILEINHVYRLASSIFSYN